MKRRVAGRFHDLKLETRNFSGLMSEESSSVYRQSGTGIAVDETVKQLRRHVEALTVDIGERSVDRPENLQKTAEYLRCFHEEIGLPAVLESYRYRNYTVSNVISEIRSNGKPARRYLLGAHYDSVRGTVGADDNASAVAVQLETARFLKSLEGEVKTGVAVKFVSFALEEHPAFWTPCRGSRVHARRAKRAREQIDGMLCLEMVGYRSRKAGSQRYPFPLMHLDYPKVGDFIGIIGDHRSAPLVHSIRRAFTRNHDLPTRCLIVPWRGWLTHFVRRSDHVSFWDAGYPAVMITDTAEFRNPHYHKKSDTLETLDYEFMAELVESLLHFFCGGEALL
jgi:Zn-dependent M28 family amino/carboxypeptidase